VRGRDGTSKTFTAIDEIAPIVRHDGGSEKSPSRVRILYIGGTGRTGSTLLTSMLGQYEQFFAAGELAFIWRFGLLGDGGCGCGVPLLSCPTWISILDKSYGGADNVDATEMMRLRRRFNSNHMPLMVTRDLRQRLMDRAGAFPATVERLYHGIQAATGSRVIVDSSKEPHYSYILNSRSSLDVFFLHLVRDPRAVAWAWTKRRKETGVQTDTEMENRGPALSSLYFDVSNVASEVLWARRPDRYLLLRYEDFLADPVTTLRSIGHFVGEEIDPSAVINGNNVALRATHTAWGNPSRFDHGTIALRPDDAWRSRLPRSSRAAVTAMTLPLVKHYGYPLFD
jgi:hypothetical protein